MVQYYAKGMCIHATTDQIRQVLQKYVEYNIPTYHLIINFESVYDTIDQNKTWLIMPEYGFLDKLTRLVEATMNRDVRLSVFWNTQEFL